MSSQVTEFRASDLKSLNLARRRAAALIGTERTVALSELFTDTFFQKHTSFSSAGAFCESIGFDIFEVNLDALPEGYQAKVAQVIRSESKFDSWQSLVQQAAIHWLSGVLQGDDEQAGHIGNSADSLSTVSRDERGSSTEVPITGTGSDEVKVSFGDDTIFDVRAKTVLPSDSKGYWTQTPDPNSPPAPRGHGYLHAFDAAIYKKYGPVKFVDERIEYSPDQMVKGPDGKPIKVTIDLSNHRGTDLAQTAEKFLQDLMQQDPSLNTRKAVALATKLQSKANWHHAAGSKMQLIPRDLHGHFSHTGEFADNKARLAAIAAAEFAKSSSKSKASATQAELGKRGGTMARATGAIDALSLVIGHMVEEKEKNRVAGMPGVVFTEAPLVFEDSRGKFIVSALRPPNPYGLFNWIPLHSERYFKRYGKDGQLPAINEDIPVKDWQSHLTTSHVEISHKEFQKFIEEGQRRWGNMKYNYWTREWGFVPGAERKKLKMTPPNMV